MFFTGKNIKTIWDAGAASRAAMARAEHYYKGTQTIGELGVLRIDGRRKTSLTTNWTRYATMLHTGFLVGHPVAYINGDESGLDELKRVSKVNNIPAADSLHMANAMRHGYSVELHTFDGSDIRTEAHNPQNWQIIDDEKGHPVAAIYHIVIPAGKVHRGKVLEKPMAVFYGYDDKKIINFEGEVGQELKQKDEIKEHSYGRLPLVVFQLNADRSPFFSRAFYDQCDVFDVSRSSLVDDIKYNVDSLLMLKGIDYEEMLEKDDNGVSVIEKLKAMKILPLPEGADASFLLRDTDVEKFKYDLRVTRAAIHLMAAIPDLDETINGHEGGTITNISGIALKLMFHAMMQQSREFELYFAQGLRDRVALLNSINDIQNRPLLNDYETAFTRNLPFNDIELVQYLPNLENVLGREDILHLLPFVKDPAESAKKSPAKAPDAAKPTPVAVQESA